MSNAGYGKNRDSIELRSFSSDDHKDVFEFRQIDRGRELGLAIERADFETC